MKHLRSMYGTVYSWGSFPDLPTRCMDTVYSWSSYKCYCNQPNSNDTFLIWKYCCSCREDTTCKDSLVENIIVVINIAVTIFIATYKLLGCNRYSDWFSCYIGFCAEHRKK